MKRVLILGNNCLSQNNNNGRTLSNLLLGYPKEKLAQFCLLDGAPDFERCERYFMVSDRDALNALVRFRRVGRRLTKTDAAKLVASPRSVRDTNNSCRCFDAIKNIHKAKRRQS